MISASVDAWGLSATGVAGVAAVGVAGGAGALAGASIDLPTTARLSSRVPRLEPNLGPPGEAKGLEAVGGGRDVKDVHAMVPQAGLLTLRSVGIAGIVKPLAIQRPERVVTLTARFR